MTLASGTRLGPYKIVGKIGAGGMGEVWKAKDTRLGRDVAIKVLPATFAEESERLKRFEQEARIVASLSHPNVLAIFDVGTHEGSPYLVTELLEGDTLRERLSAGPLTVSKAIEIAVQVARGLAAAHDKGIIHRDLKPENVFLTHDGVKILDFGLAKQAPELLHISQDEIPTRDLRNGTLEGAFLGTVGYMSPEQVRGEAVDARSDLFALGVLIYEMLSGRQAFHGASPADSLSAILKEDPPELEALAKKVPPALMALLRRCLEKRREDRFSSAQDVAYALQIVSDSSAGSSATSREVPVRTTRPWHRWLWSAAGVLLMAVLGILWTLRARPVLNTPITSLAVLPLQNYSGDANQDFFVDGMTDALIADLAQIKALKVISRTSVMQYKGAKRPLPEIAKELGVQGILEGSVLRAGNKVRITAQLIDARQDKHIWANNYERDLTDVMTLQREVVREIAGQIRIQVTPQEQLRFGAVRRVQPEVLDLTFKATALMEGALTEAELRRAMAMFQTALDKDPEHAPAWAGLAYATWTMAGMGWEFVDPREVRAQALAAAQKALDLDPELPEAHRAMAMVIGDTEWDYAKAQQHYERALELRPGYAACHNDYGQLLILLGVFDKANQHIEKAKELDPFSLYNALNRLWLLRASGRAARAVEEGEHLFKVDPKNWTIPFNMGFAHVDLGKFPEAAKDFEACLEPTNRSVAILGMLGFSYGRAGRSEEARKILAEFEQAERKRYVSPVQKAWVLVGLGRHAEAYQCLERAFEQRNPLLPWSLVPGGGQNIGPFILDPRSPDLRKRILQATRLPEGAKPVRYP